MIKIMVFRRVLFSLAFSVYGLVLVLVYYS